MEVRYSTDPKSFSKMDTTELRKLFLIDCLFTLGTIQMLYSEIDRSITGSVVPTSNALQLIASKKEMATDYFAERREIGVINIGNTGIITVDGKSFTMQNKDVLYIAKGAKEILFFTEDQDKPALFYFVSYPAHHEYLTTQVKLSGAEITQLGSKKDANERTIYKFIHPNGIKSCQLVMGFTELNDGSVWNTMPPHTHQRRSEIYMYFNLDEDARVFHFIGKPEETRHIVIRNQQAVFSPSWSVHTGVGTKKYSFVWAMGGENQVFNDMDGVNIDEIR